MLTKFQNSFYFIHRLITKKKKILKDNIISNKKYIKNFIRYLNSPTKMLQAVN